MKYFNIFNGLQNVSSEASVPVVEAMQLCHFNSESAFSLPKKTFWLHKLRKHFSRIRSSSNTKEYLFESSLFFLSSFYHQFLMFKENFYCVPSKFSNMNTIQKVIFDKSIFLYNSTPSIIVSQRDIFFNCTCKPGWHKSWCYIQKTKVIFTLVLLFINT